MLKLPQVFMDGMVLQEKLQNRIYGVDTKAKSIHLTFAGDCYESQVDEKGQWLITLPPLKLDGPQIMIIEGSSRVVINDVWLGQVFLLAGQSNMELPLSRVMDLYHEEILEDLKSSDRIIHQFSIHKEGSFTPTKAMNIKGKWQSLNNESLEDISAVGYFFAKRFQDLNDQVPIGLIQAAIGGSPIQAWCSQELLTKVQPSIVKKLAKLRQKDYVIKMTEEDLLKSEAWYEDTLSRTGNEELRSGLDEDWLKFHKDSIKSIHIPSMFAGHKELEGFSGGIWLRKKINLDIEELRDYRLRLGTIIDRDQVFVNGHKVGQTDYQYPPRNYLLPKKYLKEGENTIVILLVVNGGQGGFTKGKPYHLITDDKKICISLRGQWEYVKGQETEHAPDITFFNWEPTALYNGILFPLKELTISGVLWYQGESNESQEDQAQVYEALFKGLVSEFRSLFRQETLPILGTLLAGFDHDKKTQPGSIAAFRQCQLKANDYPNLAIVSASDLGEYNDIHPLRKKPLGNRMALVIDHLKEKKNNKLLGPKLIKVSQCKSKIDLQIQSNTGFTHIEQNPDFQICYEENGHDKWLNLSGDIGDMKDDCLWIQLRLPVWVGQVKALGYGHLDFPLNMTIRDTMKIPMSPFLVSMEDLEEWKELMI